MNQLNKKIPAEKREFLVYKTATFLLKKPAAQSPSCAKSPDFELIK
jgi:hypothetical protein